MFPLKTMDNLLTICIPTYNRAKILDGLLRNLLVQIKGLQIKVCISDNASTDNTTEIVRKYQALYPYIIYSKNETNIEDNNFVKALQMSKTKYAWLVADKTRLIDGAIMKVTRILSSKAFDAVIVNTVVGSPAKRICPRVKDLKNSKNYDDVNDFLGQLGWHITLLGSVIWSDKLIKQGRFDKYLGSNFIQLGVIADYLASHKFSIYWQNEPLAYNAAVPSGWFNQAFAVFGEKWYEFVSNLPTNYTSAVKGKCIKDHGVKSRLFTFYGILLLRVLNIYNRRVYTRYRAYWPYISNVPLPLLWIISLLPIPAGVGKLAERAITQYRKWVRKGLDK